MDHKRRKFLKIIGISALGVGALPVVDALQKAKVLAQQPGRDIYAKSSNALVAKRWAMAIDTRMLDHGLCEKIAAACHSAHNVPDHKDRRHEVKWIWEEPYQHVFPERADVYLPDSLKTLSIPVLCNHCANPPCVRVCPTGATFQQEDGIVQMDFHRCIGCRFCMAACPYGSRSFNFVDPRKAIKNINRTFPTRMKGVVEKCNFCAERLAVGNQPACVEASSGAMIFGDLEDEGSPIRQALKKNYTICRKENLGTTPSVYYVI